MKLIFFLPYVDLVETYVTVDLVEIHKTIIFFSVKKEKIKGLKEDHFRLKIEKESKRMHLLAEHVENKSRNA